MADMAHRRSRTHSRHKAATQLFLAALAVVLLPYTNAALRADASPRPNVVLIMADDLGYGDLECYGHPKIKTPVLDRLAEAGVRLTDFHAGATVCTPSRMALLTGAYPSRVGWTRGVIGYMISTKAGLNPETLTMAEVFKAGGYRTGMMGKWHLGHPPALRPHRHGFDETYYIQASNNMSRDMFRGDERVERSADNRLLTEKFSHEAIAFIRSNRQKPFFLYVPYTAPHFPVEAHPDWKGTSEFGAYGDVVEEMDHRVGEILTALKEENLDRKTIVVFLSDNGPQDGEQARATPFRGKKWSALEGGTRVPCIVSWPGVIPAGRETDALVSAIDLLPTLAHPCGIDLDPITDDVPKIDGVNVWRTLLGEDGPHAREDLLYWHGKEGFGAIRVGDWKLFVEAEDATEAQGASGVALFNLADDPGETNDLSDQHPQKVEQMKQLARKRLADIHSNTIPLARP